MKTIKWLVSAIMVLMLFAGCDMLGNLGGVIPGEEDTENPADPSDPSDPGNNVANAVALADGAEATLAGTIMARYAKGFVLNDGKDNMLVFENTAVSDYPVGTKVTVKGKKNTYGGQAQLQDISSIEEKGKGEVKYPEPVVYDSSNISNLSEQKLPVYVRYSGKLSISGNYYNVVIDGASIQGSIAYPTADMISKLTPLNGSMVTVTGYYVGMTGSNKYVSTLTVSVEEGTGADTPSDPGITDGKGTLDSPYSPAQVLSMGEDNSFDASKEIYVTGIVSQIREVSTRFGNASFYVSADGAAINHLQVYRCQYLNGADFTSEDQIKLGDKVVVAGKITLYNSVAQIAEGGKLISLDSSDGGNVTPTPSQPTGKWLELPAKGNVSTAKEYVIRSGKRNYTAYYDTNTYSSLWVAYPLAKGHMGSLARPEGWYFAPEIDQSLQVDLTARSYNDNYSRGHQIANADRNGDETMQLQTFYVINSVPQIQDNFNGGIWADLEGAVRSAVPANDTLYIATGPVYKTVGGSETLKYTTAKNDDKQLPVANYFFKVVLKVRRSSGNITDAKAVGFWFEHRAYSGSYEACAVTVDEIEKKTGYDFFANLPDSVEATAEQNSSWSSFKSF